MTVAEMIEKRKALYEQAKAILEAARARKDSPALTDEERSKYDGFLAEMEDLKGTIEREQRAAQIELEMRTGVNDPVRPSTELENRRSTKEQDDQRKAFVEYLRGDNPEKRALTVGTHGTVLLPNTLFDRIVEGVRFSGGVRAAGATVLPNFVGTVRIPVITDAKKGHRVAAGAATESDPTSTANKTLTTYDYTSDVIPVDRTLLSGSPLAVEEYLGGLLIDRIARIFNEEATTGSGSGMPEGILTSATLGVTGATVAGITFDELQALEHSVPASRRIKARFMFNDKTLLAIKKLKDSDGKALWASGNVAQGTPATILGYGYSINDDLPDLGAGNKAVIFGDVSLYHIADGPEMRVQVLNELYAKNNQVGLILFSSHGGVSADGAGAIRYFQNAAS